MRGRGHLPPDLHVECNAGRIAAPCTPATAPATVAGRTAVAKVARARVGGVKGVRREAMCW